MGKIFCAVNPLIIKPKSVPSDFYYILSDPTKARLERMILFGKRATFPKISMISNRLRIERQIELGRAETRSSRPKSGPRRQMALENSGTVFSGSDSEVERLRPEKLYRSVSSIRQLRDGEDGLGEYSSEEMSDQERPSSESQSKASAREAYGIFSKAEFISAQGFTGAT